MAERKIAPAPEGLHWHFSTARTYSDLVECIGHLYLITDGIVLDERDNVVGWPPETRPAAPVPPMPPKYGAPIRSSRDLRRVSRRILRSFNREVARLEYKADVEASIASIVEASRCGKVLR